MNEYRVGFKKIFTNVAASLVLFGIVLRIWETAITSYFMTNYFKVYTAHNDAFSPKQNQLYADSYGPLVSTAVLLGSVLSNVMSGFIISLFDDDNPMTIPYVCAVRHLIDLPCLYMIFMQQ